MSLRENNESAMTISCSSFPILFAWLPPKDGGVSVKCLAHYNSVNLPACSTHWPFDTELQAEKLSISN